MLVFWSACLSCLPFCQSNFNGWFRSQGKCRATLEFRSYGCAVSNNLNYESSLSLSVSVKIIPKGELWTPTCHVYLKSLFKIIQSRKVMRNIISTYDTHMEELVLYWIQYKHSSKYKVGCFWRCLHNQLSSFNSIIVQMPEKRDSSISKTECLLLSVTFTAKLELVFVLTFENVFS